MELSINDLGMVWETVYEARTKAYEIGLRLKVPVDTLDSIEGQYRDPGEKLREVLKTWLKTAPKPTWQVILDALSSRVVGQPKLARDIEAEHKRCFTVEAARVSRKKIPEVLPQQPTSAATQPHTLRQEIQTTAMQQKPIQDMRWQIESKAPENIRRGSAAADANMAYFNGRNSTTVHSYNSDTREWRQLPDAPHTESTLVVVDHILTMVGGQISDRATNSLLSLMGEGRRGKWLTNLPAMPTKRYYTAAVCSGHSLIVAGGRIGRNYLATVEVLDTDTRQWSIASSLTHPFCLATISICGKRLYMLGGVDQTGRETRSVLSCSISKLLQSCQPQPLAGKLRTAPANKSIIWRPIADVPHEASSGATLCGQLVAVGGFKAGKKTSAIAIYNEATGSWEDMGNMPTDRYWALVAILNGKMMVVGGVVGSWMVIVGTVVLTATDAAEIFC